MISIFSLLFILQIVLAQEKFNIFKSYANSKTKPHQYSREKRNVRHSIQEYLDPTQKKMYKLRYGKDKPNAMFDKRWSGFNLKENKRSNLRGVI